MHGTARPPMEIRDPIHGPISVTPGEKAIIDHPFVQRLRGIRQLGFAQLPFPGATHTRYAHSIGAMHLAGKAFDACFRGVSWSTESKRLLLRQLVRLGALCHDLGHAPFSHSSEFAMPLLADLQVDVYPPGHGGGRRAGHEDYTIAILTQSTLAASIEEQFAFTGRHVAALVSADVVVEDDLFEDEGRDLRTLLSQLISSQLDVDRMDYLIRDSTFTGTQYGLIDLSWIISNLTQYTEPDGRTCLGFDSRALYTFDDFTVARFHMFVMVYFHQRSLIYEEMLKRYVKSADCLFRIPTDIEEYLYVDDIHLVSLLRQSTNPWARRVVEMRPYKVVLERHGHAVSEIPVARERLTDGGFDIIEAETEGHVVGKRKPGAPPIYVVDRQSPVVHATKLESATGIFERYQEQRKIARLYVPQKDLERARALLID